MRILVLGAGAVGGYFGGRLVEAGADVTFLVRERRAAELAAKGLVVESPHGSIKTAVRTVTAGAEAGGFDLIMLACKAYDLEAAIRDVTPFAADAGLLPLLNGIAHLDRLDAAFGRASVLGGSCHIGVTALPDGTIRHMNDLHALTFGARDAAAAPLVRTLAGLLDRAKVASRPSEDILGEMWSKYVMLATLAGATCLMRVPVGAIMATDEGERLMLGMLGECEAVAAAAGFRPPPAFMAATRAALTDRSSSSTASMLRDIQRGGPTEADHILGDMVRQAAAAGLETPLLRIALCHLQAYEATRRAHGNR